MPRMTAERMEMKKILFVVNTLGRAGAETALLELLRRLERYGHQVFLYVIMGQGEMAEQLPSYIRLLNQEFSRESVLTPRGKRIMMKTVFRAFFRNGDFGGKVRYFGKRYSEMQKSGRVQTDKALWRILSDGAECFDETFDLAVAYIEGASAYYVADHVKAARKCAFIHIDYGSAGYTREMDRDCWDSFDRIFTVSEEVKGHFLAVYPEYTAKVGVFPNLLDQDRIRSRAEEKPEISDSFDGFRLLTVGRLTVQKAYDIAIEAMKLIKDAGYRARWYVLGEGDQRKKLEKKIAALGLQEDFRLLGAVGNPYPYYKQADLYIHATRFEGKSIAIQEAKALGCAVIASDCNGNREQIEDGVDGILCELTPHAVADAVCGLLEDEEKRRALGREAAKRQNGQSGQLDMLLRLLE